jgi:hypothetical protein
MVDKSINMVPMLALPFIGFVNLGNNLSNIQSFLEDCDIFYFKGMLRRLNKKINMQ